MLPLKTIISLSISFRFCDALIQIRREIDQIAEGVYDLKDNPLKNAPHTEDMVTSEEWDHW